MARKSCLKTTLSIVVLLFVISPSNAASLQPIGHFEGGTTYGVPHSVSANGLVVVGRGVSASGSEAYRWENGIMIGLGDLPGDVFYSEAYDVSADGSVVVGVSKAASGKEAFRWENGVMTGLGDLPGGEFRSNAISVSANGLVITGSSDSATGYQAFRWENGIMKGLGYLAGGAYSHARGISADGSVVVGNSDSSYGRVAFRWENGTMMGLGDLPGGSIWSIATDVSDDGSVVVGASYSASGREAIRWTASTGMVALGALPGGYYNSFANAVSADGSIVVGISGDRAFIWDTIKGMRNLKELLESKYRLDLNGWILYSATGISADGLTIVGDGGGPKGCEDWIAVLSKPEPTVIYVDDNASGANDGSSWADAFNYLQDALTAAWSGDEIRVAQGIYKPDRGDGITPGDREATFHLINGVAIKGGYAGAGTPDPNARDIELYETILSGDLNGDDIDMHYSEDLACEPTRAENSYHVVTGSGADANAVLNGFTVIGGHANSSSPHSQGGGMYNYYGSPTLVDCIFTRNTALYGGGISNYVGNPTLNNCLFNYNWAFYSSLHHSGGIGGGMFNSESSPTVVNGTFSDGYAYNAAGGVYNSGGSPTFTNCEFVENGSSGWGGGGMHNEGSSPILSGCRFNENGSGSGGGITNLWSDLVLTNCSFSFNQAPDGGGGIYNYGSSLILIDCHFVSNLAGYASIQNGGGIMNFQSTLTLTNCEFRSNKAGSSGGGIHNDDSVLTLTDCVFTNNEAGAGGGMYNHYNSVVMLTDCVFKNNEAGIGGGMYNNHDSNSTLFNCIFSENSAYSEWFSDGGGGIATGNTSNSIVTNCLFNGNSAQYTGGAIHNWGGNCTLTNCIFSSNSAGYAGAVIYVYNGRYSSYSQTVNNCTFYDNLTPNGNALACDSYSQRYPGNVQITNSILWDEPNQVWNNDNSEITITYSDVCGSWPGEGNSDADPQFINPVYCDYHLLSDSPCIDAGDPNYVAGPNETDLDGKPRVLDGDNDGFAVVDMGAYEYRFTISAGIRIVPRTLNLASKGNWITCYIRLPDEHDVADIEPNSIFLEGEIKPEQFSVDEQQQVATARFNREDVQGILVLGDVELKVNGWLTDGNPFEGKDTIKVIEQSGKK